MQPPTTVRHYGAAPMRRARAQGTRRKAAKRFGRSQRTPSCPQDPQTSKLNQFTKILVISQKISYFLRFRNGNRILSRALAIFWLRKVFMHLWVASTTPWRYRGRSAREFGGSQPPQTKLQFFLGNYKNFRKLQKLHNNFGKLQFLGEITQKFRFSQIFV